MGRPAVIPEMEKQPSGKKPCWDPVSVTLGFVPFPPHSSKSVSNVEGNVALAVFKEILGSRCHPVRLGIFP